MTEPSPIRDNGPYESPDQANAQFAAVTFGIPTSPDRTLSRMVLKEALMMVGLMPLTDFEADAVATIAEELAPARVQVIVGWLVRSHLNGRRSQ